MIDLHDHKLPGIHILPSLPDLPGVSAYSLFVSLGLAAGLLYLVWARKHYTSRESQANRTSGNDGRIDSAAGDAGRAHPSGPAADQPVPPALIIVAAALIGGTIGAKIPILLTYTSLADLLVGKSIVGGLLGGMAGVLLIKRLLHIRLRLGNDIAPAAALGLAIGRLGCFFNGCCYGVPAAWGVDFGDGQLRLPAQLFEAGFHLAAFLLLHRLRTRVRIPGILFKFYVAVYFLFRFLIEFIRVNPVYWLGLTIYQLLSLAGIVWMALMLIRQLRLRAADRVEVSP